MRVLRDLGEDRRRFGFVQRLAQKLARAGAKSLQDDIRRTVSLEHTIAVSGLSLHSPLDKLKVSVQVAVEHDQRGLRAQAMHLFNGLRGAGQLSYDRERRLTGAA